LSVDDAAIETEAFVLFLVNIITRYPFSNKCVVKAFPTNPVPPVIKIVSIVRSKGTRVEDPA
jgi:hypothetical protein